MLQQLEQVPKFSFINGDFKTLETYTGIIIGVISPICYIILNSPFPPLAIFIFKYTK